MALVVPFAAGCDFLAWLLNDPGYVEGMVIDAVSKDPLPGVSVELYLEDVLLTSDTTDSDGMYKLEMLPGSDYRVRFHKNNYLTVDYRNVEIQENVVTYLEMIMQVIDNPTDRKGNAGGIIKDAKTGAVVGGLNIKLREGMNAKSGIIKEITQTGSDGKYLFEDLNAGYYTAEVSGLGYITAYFTVISIGGADFLDQNYSVRTELAPDEISIVLTWGAEPRDLDSHLTGPRASGDPSTSERFHIYYSNKSYKYGGVDYADLDVDDTSSYGPETVTIRKKINGLYRYSVHDYTNRNSNPSTHLANSGAKVEVYRGDSLWAVYRVPNQGGTLWTVFTISGNTITPVNSMGYQATPSSITSLENPVDDSDLIYSVSETK